MCKGTRSGACLRVLVFAQILREKVTSWISIPLSVETLVLGEMQLCICIIKPEARLKRSMRTAIGIF